MPKSYIKVYIHYVFTVKGRSNFLLPQHNNELQKYITGIVQNRKCKMLAINNVPDHVHMLIGIHPAYSISKLIQEVKAISSQFINKNRWVGVKFQWQKGYGAFSYSRSQINNVIRYIENQQKHHKKKNFEEEYIEFLKKFAIEFDNKKLFEFYDK